jgi:hypothetical protein
VRVETGRRRPGVWVLVASMSVFIVVVLLAFLVPAVNSGASKLPLSVSGPDLEVAGFVDGLEDAQPGVFDVSIVEDRADVVSAVKSRDSIGGVSLDSGDVAVTTAGGAGTAYTSLLRTVGDRLALAGDGVTYTDVAPLTDDDPQGAAVAAMGFPMIIGGIAAGAIFSTVYQGRMRNRIFGVAVLAVVAGAAAAALLKFGIGAVDGSFWLLTLALSMAIGSVAYVDFGLSRLIGLAGMAPLAILLMFVGNPLAGLAAGPDWLPSPWGTIGQLMPPGASGTVVRSVSYFDGQGAGMAWVVLICWVLVGLAITALAAAKERRASLESVASAA